MPQLIQWNGRRLIRGTEAVTAELDLRQDTFARLTNTPGQILFALHEYHQWLSAQWDGCHAERWRAHTPPNVAMKPAGSSFRLSGDEQEPGWVAFITGGAMAFTRILELTNTAAGELACAHYLHDVTFDIDRTNRLHIAMRKLARQYAGGQRKFQLPHKGLLGMGARHFRWWLRQPTPRKAPDNIGLGAAACILEQHELSTATVDHDVYQLPANLIKYWDCLDIPAFLRGDPAKQWAAACKRRGTTAEPPAYIDLIKAGNVLIT